jgi:hypothetical protein
MSFEPDSPRDNSPKDNHRPQVGLDYGDSETARAAGTA